MNPRAAFVVGMFRNAFRKNSLRILSLFAIGRPVRLAREARPRTLPLTRAYQSMKRTWALLKFPMLSSMLLNNSICQ